MSRRVRRDLLKNMAEDEATYLRQSNTTDLQSEASQCVLRPMAGAHRTRWPLGCDGSFVEYGAPSVFCTLKQPHAFFQRRAEEWSASHQEQFRESRPTGSRAPQGRVPHRSRA